MKAWEVEHETGTHSIERGELVVDGGALLFCDETDTGVDDWPEGTLIRAIAPHCWRSVRRCRPEEVEAIAERDKEAEHEKRAALTASGNIEDDLRAAWRDVHDRGECLPAVGAFGAPCPLCIEEASSGPSAQSGVGTGGAPSIASDRPPQ